MTDDAAATIGSGELGPQQLDELGEWLDLSSIDRRAIDAKVFDTEMVALIVGHTPEDVLAEAMDGDLREVIVPEIFRRMPERLDPFAAADVQAAIEWRITRNGAGDPDSRILVIEEGSCRVEDSLEGVPGVTLEMGPVELLLLATGNGNSVEMFMSGRLRVQGDIMFAAKIPGLFRTPKPRAA